MVSGMRLNRNIITNGLIILTILSITLSVVNCEEVKKKEEVYDYKPSGYPGSETNKGTAHIIKQNTSFKYISIILL